MTSTEERFRNEIGRLDKRIDDLSLTKLRETNRILRRELDYILHSPHAGIFVDVGGDVTITDQSTFFIMTNSTVLIDGAENFDMPQDGRMRYIGTDNRIFRVCLAASYAPVGAGQSIHIKLMKNGTGVDHSEIHGEAGGGTTHHTLTTKAEITLRKNDYVEPGVQNETAAGADDGNVEHVILAANALPQIIGSLTLP